MSRENQLRLVLTDIHFLIPLAVLGVGIALLFAIH
jgi:hypothetical protein